MSQLRMGVEWQNYANAMGSARGPCRRSGVLRFTVQNWLRLIRCRHD
jgi:hypothetical protein